MREQWQMAKDFHAAFGLPSASAPRQLDPDRANKRAEWMRAELKEFIDATDIADQADALIDLMYLALGTFVEMGLNPTEMYALVHEANMAKLWPDGQGRVGPEGKVAKPNGWKSPRERLLRNVEAQRAMARGPRPKSGGEQC